MKNERGFFTIVGLCLLLALAVCIQGVQEFEENYSVGATSFQIEHELQNAAESALVEAAEKIRIVGSENFQKHFGDERQPKIEVSPPHGSERLKNFSVKVYAERKPVARYWRSYSAERKYTDTANRYYDSTTVLISVASCDSNFIGGKIYRRALAYVIDGDTTLHFLNDLSNEFKHDW